jgi:hypothetical protein
VVSVTDPYGRFLGFLDRISQEYKIEFNFKKLVNKQYKKADQCRCISQKHNGTS